MPIAIAGGVHKPSTNQPYDLAMRVISSGNHATNLPQAGNLTSFKTGKIGRGGTNKVQLLFPLFRINQSTADEELNAGIGTFRAALNYPVGSANWYSFTFGGNASGTHNVGDYFIKTDILELPVTLVEDTMVGWKTEAKWSGGDGSSFNALSLGRGEWVAFGDTDYFSPHSAPASPSAGAGYAPILLGETHEPAFGIAGDSRMEGQNASQFGDLYGDRSFSERWVSQKLRLGYLNCGLNGDSYVDFSGGNDMRMALMQAAGCSHLFLAYGVNDLLAYSGTVGSFTAGRIPLVTAKAIRMGFKRCIVNVPAGRSKRIGNTGDWSEANQEAYNQSWSPSDNTSQWGILQDTILAMRPDTHGVDMVVTAERDYCHSSPYDPRAKLGAGGLSVFDGDGVHEKELDHTAIAMLMPAYHQIP